MATSTRTFKMDASRARTLQSALEEAGFDMKDAPYCTFSAKGDGVSVSHYESGKLVVQGKEIAAFLERFVPECTAAGSAPKEALIGADESGKGDYFGPLVCAAVALTPDIARFLDEVPLQDSKTLSARDIAEAADTLRRVLPYEIVMIGPAKYNELYPKFNNVNTMLAWAHAKAITAVVAKSGVKKVLLDKFCEEHVVRRALGPAAADLDFSMRVRAESEPAVAAASILARDAFVRGLKKLEHEIGHPLPPGAGGPTERAARALVRAKGPSVLPSVAKMHFRTTEKILGEA